MVQTLDTKKNKQKVFIYIHFNLVYNKVAGEILLRKNMLDKKKPRLFR